MTQIFFHYFLKKFGTNLIFQFPFFFPFGHIKFLFVKHALFFFYLSKSDISIVIKSISYLENNDIFYRLGRDGRLNRTMSLCAIFGFQLVTC